MLIPCIIGGAGQVVSLASPPALVPDLFILAFAVASCVTKDRCFTSAAAHDRVISKTGRLFVNS